MRRFQYLLTVPLTLGAATWACPLWAVRQQIAAPIDVGDEHPVREADGLFWAAFNSCDEAGMSERFTNDVEFYHDKTGLTQSRRAVTASMFTGPCANPAALRVRREAVPRTDRFYPLAGGFAMLEGEHRFLATQPGGSERHDSVARFIEVWQQGVDHVWRMRRVVSFDHGPDEPVLTATRLAPGETDKYLGSYVADDGSTIAVSDDGGLKLKSGHASFPLVRLAAGRFGTPGRWLEFRFAGDSLTILEEGKEVARGRRASSASQVK